MAEVTYHHGVKAKPWEKHLQYLDHLSDIFGSVDEPTIAAGDFNQRTPRVKGANRPRLEKKQLCLLPIAVQVRCGHAETSRVDLLCQGVNT